MSKPRVSALRHLRVATAFSSLALAAALPVAASASRPRKPSGDVLTYHNDNARTGQALGETVLTPEAVGAPGRFGKLYSWPVDGQVYAQPLYVSGLNVAGKGKRNVVFVATEHDTVYAFDADSPDSAPLWQRSFLDPTKGVTSVPSDEAGSGNDLTPEIGITGTPVIDRKAGTLYVVAKTKERGSSNAPRYVHRLHALDIESGDERKGSPVEITATVAGRGDGSEHGTLTFNPLREHQRPALLLLDGVVYIAWGSHADHGPYHGWIIGYDGKSLERRAVWCANPNGGLAGIWMSGAGLAADETGNVFFDTGNGSAVAADSSYGDSFVRLARGDKGALTFADFFMPFNHEDLNARDADLCSGVLLLPDDKAAVGRKLLIGGGKDGLLYLVDRERMGHVLPNRDDVVQTFRPGGAAFNMPAFYRDTLYFTGVGSGIRAIPLAGGKFRETPLGETPTRFGFPGCTPSVSANGDTGAIVWAIEIGVPGALHAYDAADVRRELFTSRALPADDLGQAIKFSVPTVAGNKVFVGGPARISVFGLRPPQPVAAAINAAPASPAAATPGPIAGLFGYWSFDEGTGATAHDTALNAGGGDGNGRIDGEATWDTGIVGRTALDLHGVGNAVSRVVLPDQARYRFAATESFSLSLWVRPSASAAAGRMMAVVTRANPNAGAPPVWGLYITPNRRWSFGELGAPDALVGGDAGSRWHLVAVVQDGDAGRRTLYVDGKEAASGPAFALDAPGELYLGAAANVPQSSLVGTIDDFRIYGRALTRDDIKALVGTANATGR
jgi:hypothetical protein